MTDPQYLQWLQSPSAIRCILVEVGVKSGPAELVRYLSNLTYSTSSVIYMPVIGGGVTIQEKLSIDGSASMSYGDLELINNGELDAWLEDVWTNRAIDVFFGDVRWPRAEFRRVFCGTVAGLDSRSRNTLNLRLRDKLQRLNTPLSAAKLGGTTDKKDQLKPLLFGECHNVEPLLINPATLQYQVHDGAIERIIEVRDNGVPVGFNPAPASGTFTLLAQPAGTITCSAQGDKFGGVYRNTVGTLVQRIVTGYGKLVDRFSAADVDAPSLAVFEAAHPQPVGLYVPDRMNVLQACADLASSVGAQVVMSRLGTLQLLKVRLPAVGPVTAVDATAMLERSLSVTDRPEVVASVKVGYCKNWTVQSNLQTGIPEANKSLLAQEWMSVTVQDAPTAAVYKLTAEPEQVDTLLLTTSDATAEASRRLELWKPQRTVYSYTATPALMLQTLGSAQKITHARYGLAAGKTGQIVGLSQDWLKGRVTLEVLI